LAPALDQASQLKLTEIKEKVGSLERLLERDVARSSAPVAVTGGHRGLPGDPEDDDPEDEKDYLEPTPLAVVDAAYEMDGDDNDLLDLGIQMGKMRITERIGGFFRPKISQEVCLFLPAFLSVGVIIFLERVKFLLSYGLIIVESHLRQLVRFITVSRQHFFQILFCSRLLAKHFSKTFLVEYIEMLCL